MRTIAEGLIHRSATAAERERRLARQVILVAIPINQFNRAFRTFDTIWTVLPDRDLDARQVPPWNNAESKDNSLAGCPEICTAKEGNSYAAAAVPALSKPR